MMEINADFSKRAMMPWQASPMPGVRNLFAKIQTKLHINRQNM
jgi:hypothetical protein